MSERPHRASSLIAEHLGLDELTVAGLRARAAASLGPDRVAKAWRFVEAARPSQRREPLAALAALAVGTDLVGQQWWDEPIVSMYPRDWHPLSDVLRRAGRDGDDPALVITPSQVLAGELGWTGPLWSGSPLGELAWSVAETVAGPADGYVDLNWPGTHLFDRPDVADGTEVVLEYDAGGRICGVTERDDDGRLVVRVDLDTTTHSLPAELHWAVSVSWQGVAVRLPGEDAGTPADPFSQPLHGERLAVAEAIRAWASQHGVPTLLTEQPWTSLASVTTAWVASYGASMTRHENRVWLGGTDATRHGLQLMCRCLIDHDLSRLDGYYREQLAAATGAPPSLPEPDGEKP